ncbi:MAG: integrase arm-type DNA-binding domain-containing protein [Gemmatimonadales bacterium]|nr:integrase arm-type DNA-binding domain-containing protein [Gemmatimonadales bacterium]
MATARLTKRVVDAATAQRTGDRWLWDAEVRGLGLKVTPTGRRVFALKYRVPGQRATRKLTLGTYPAITLDQARSMAKQALGRIATGQDPARERAQGRTAPTMAEALRDYLRDHHGRWKTRTAAEYAKQVEEYLIPALGSIRVQDLSRADVGAFVRRFGNTPVLANRLLALLSAFCTAAVQAGLRPDGVNPCRHFPRFKERSRTRFLTGEELTRLGAALTAAEAGRWNNVNGEPLPPAPWQSIAAVRLLALTGCRRGEILDLRWAEVDLERGHLRLRDTKSGESVRPLSGAARAILEGLPQSRPDNRVLPGTKGRRHEIKPAWMAVRRLAGLDDVRLHDLRHTVASRSQHSGHSLLVTGSLLGHRNLQTTQKYAHLVADPVQEAADRVAGEIEALMSGRQTQTVPLVRRR